MSERRSEAQVAAVDAAMSAHALTAWRSAEARRGLSDHAALVQYADALSRWSERLRMAMRGELTGGRWVPVGGILRWQPMGVAS